MSVFGAVDSAAVGGAGVAVAADTDAADSQASYCSPAPDHYL